jgi:hypothetical protein
MKEDRRFEEDDTLFEMCWDLWIFLYVYNDDDYSIVLEKIMYTKRPQRPLLVAGEARIA